MDSLLEAPDEVEAAVELPGNGSDPETEVEERQMTAEFLQWLRDVIEANPRARKQLLAVAMKYLEEWDDEEIAAALGTTVANVHVLRSRGLAKLRVAYRKQSPSARFSGAAYPEE